LTEEDIMEGQNLHPSFQLDEYLFRRKVFKIFGGAFHVYDKDKNVVLYSQQKAFKLKEDFRVYADDSKTQELLTIKTPQVLDLWATYNVQDATTNELVGSIRRKAMKSILRDEWTIFSPDGQEIGKLTEKSLIAALLTRFVCNLIPQKYSILTMDEKEAAGFDQHFNPFILRYTMRIPESAPSIDRRLIIAAGILLAGIERRQ